MKRQRDLILLGQQIRQLRKEKRYSQEEFAFAIEMNRGYYGTIERGEANVTVLNLLKIAKGLQVSMSTLFPEEIFNNDSDQTCALIPEAPLKHEASET